MFYLSRLTPSELHAAPSGAGYLEVPLQTASWLGGSHGGGYWHLTA